MGVSARRTCRAWEPPFPSRPAPARPSARQSVRAGAAENRRTFPAAVVARPRPSPRQRRGRRQYHAGATPTPSGVRFPRGARGLPPPPPRATPHTASRPTTPPPLPLGRIRNADLARQSPPIGERLCLGVPVPIHRIIRRHILRPLAPQRADKPAIVGEVVTAVMELHPVTVPRQRHIGRMTVHPRRR